MQKQSSTLQNRFEICTDLSLELQLHVDMVYGMILAMVQYVPHDCHVAYRQIQSR